MIIRTFLLTLTLLSMATTAVAADPQALPAPVKALQTRGIHVVGTFDAPDGLTGYAAVMGQRPLAIYVTEGGKHAIIGTLVDSQGQFPKRKTLEKMVAGPMTKQIWSQLDNSTWVAEGAEDAPRTIYVFSDPNCPYCHQFWKQARPWLKAGTVQLRHIIVGIISDTSPNKAAAILTADDPGKTLTENKKHFSEGGIDGLKEIPADIQNKLQSNLQLMQQMGIRGTPGIIYRDADDHVQFQRGVPRKGDMTEIMGPVPD